MIHSLRCLGPAVAIALAAGCFVPPSQLLPPTQPATDLVEVLVSKEDLPQGTKLDVKTMFEAKPFPKDAVPPRVVNDPLKLQGRLLARTLNAGQFVTERDLVPLGQSILEKLEPGYRAMTIRASGEGARAGWLQPGVRVGLVAVVRDDKDEKNLQAKLFLHGVKVLAVSEGPDDRDSKGLPITVTLMLKPAEVERLFLITSRGQIGMVLYDLAKLKEPGPALPIHREMEPGRHALTIPLPQQPGVWMPGSRVDVCDARDSDRQIAANVKVLAVTTGLITLSVTPEQTEQVYLATQRPPGVVFQAAAR